MRYVNTLILSAVDTASVIGPQIDMDAQICASFQVVFADATAAGTVKIQVSNDICTQGHLPSSFVVTNWSDLPTASVTPTVGGVFLIPKIDMSYRWIRAVYTRSSGGTSTVSVSMMALGA